MSEMTADKCEVCGYWQRLGYTLNGVGAGSCKYRAPVVIQRDKPDGYGKDYETRWPETKSIDWCAKFWPESLVRKNT